MLKIVCCTALMLVALAPSLIGQKRFPLRETTDSLRFQVVEQSGKLAIDAPGLLAPGNYNIIQSIALDDADLLVNCADPVNGNQKQELPSQFVLWLRSGQGELVAARAPEITDTPGKIRQIRWMDLTESSFVLGTTYILVVKKSTMGLVDCSAERPVFPLKEKLPHFAVSGLALVAIGVGQFYNQQKKSDYDAYLQLWGERKLSPDAQPFFDSAQKNERSARILFIGGLVVLVTDAAIFSNQSIKLRRKQQIYDRFCAPSTPTKNNSLLRVSPFMDLIPGNGNAPIAGLNVVFSF